MMPKCGSIQSLASAPAAPGLARQQRAAISPASTHLREEAEHRGALNRLEPSHGEAQFWGQEPDTSSEQPRILKGATRL